LGRGEGPGKALNCLNKEREKVQKKSRTRGPSLYQNGNISETGFLTTGPMKTKGEKLALQGEGKKHIWPGDSFK